VSVADAAFFFEPSSADFVRPDHPQGSGFKLG